MKFVIEAAVLGAVSASMLGSVVGMFQRAASETTEPASQPELSREKKWQNRAMDYLEMEDPLSSFSHEDIAMQARLISLWSAHLASFSRLELEDAITIKKLAPCMKNFTGHAAYHDYPAAMDDVLAMCSDWHALVDDPMAGKLAGTVVNVMNREAFRMDAESIAELPSIVASHHAVLSDVSRNVIREWVLHALEGTFHPADEGDTDELRLAALKVIFPQAPGDMPRAMDLSLQRGGWSMEQVDRIITAMPAVEKTVADKMQEKQDTIRRDRMMDFTGLDPYQRNVQWAHEILKPYLPNAPLEKNGVVSIAAFRYRHPKP